MKRLKSYFYCLTSELVLMLICGCSTNRFDTSMEALPHSNSVIATNASVSNTISSGKNALGKEQIFTNANVVMWVPLEAAKVWDGPTSVVKVDKFTLPHTRPEGYKIMVEIQIELEQEFRKDAQLYQDWSFQEHPTLSLQDVPVGKQLRKDIRDPDKRRILLINGMVERSDTFQEDVETAKKMIESIKLIPK